MLVQHFVRGLNERINGGVQLFEPKSMEVVMEKACLVEDNFNSTLGGTPGAQIVSAPITGSFVRGA